MLTANELLILQIIFQLPTSNYIVLHCLPLFFPSVLMHMRVLLFALQVKRDIGNVTIVINNAGIMKVSSFLDSSDRDIESLYNVNVFSNFWVCSFWQNFFCSHVCICLYHVLEDEC